MSPSNLVEAKGLGRTFRVGGFLAKRQDVAAVAGIDISLARGETVALVGESGCGKSTLGRLLLGVDRPDMGCIRFDGNDLSEIGGRERQRLRARMQLVFQNALAALDPRMTVGAQILEPFAIHGNYLDTRKFTSLERLMSDVGLGIALADRFSHQLSGGQRQRVVIARALATAPDFVVFDEPVSALDVSVQAQIIALIRRLQKERGFASIFISHDLRVVRHISDRVIVMYLGRIVESGPTAEVLHNPTHPYTRALVAAIPRLIHSGKARKGVAERMRGEPPNPAAIPVGCAFHPRCPISDDLCRRERPELLAHKSGRAVACHAFPSRSNFPDLSPSARPS